MKNLIFSLCIFCTISSCTSQVVHENIILINIDTLSRNQIASIISRIDSFNPKVVGLDVLFTDRTRYEDDLKLISSLYSCKNLVMARLIRNYTAEDIEYYGFQ